MPDQNEIERLLNLLKNIAEDNRVIRFPTLGTQSNISVESVDRPVERFRIVINRKPKISGRCSFLEIHGKNGVLLRLDIVGPPHTNPDGTSVSCPHIHIAREEYDTSWAYQLNTYGIATFDDLVTQLYEFMRYCNIINHGNYLFQTSL